MAGSLAGSIFRISSAHSYDFSAEEEDSLSSVNGAGDFANEFYGGSEADSLNQGAEDDPNGMYINSFYHFCCGILRCFRSSRCIPK